MFRVYTFDCGNKKFETTIVNKCTRFTKKQIFRRRKEFENHFFDKMVGQEIKNEGLRINELY